MTSSLKCINLLTLLFVVVSCCQKKDNNQITNDRIGEEKTSIDSCKVALEKIYKEVILGTAPANKALHEVCTQSLQQRLNERARQDAKKYGETDDCTECLTPLPFVATCIEALPSSSDSCQLIEVRNEGKGWYRVDFDYYGAKTWSRVKTITINNKILIDSVETEK